MPIFSFLCHCFSPDGTGKKNSPSLTRGFEEKGSNFVAVSSEKAMNNDQIVSVDSKVISKCNESVPVNMISELPISRGAQSILIDLEVQNNQCNIGESEIFMYSELEEATSNFDTSRILGKGGYGTVYSGKNFHFISTFTFVVRFCFT